VFRPPEVVFNPLTIDSFKNIPITIQHPDSGVSPDNAKFVSSGHIGSDVSKIDDERLGATIHIYDKDAIDISRGSQTSAGYDCPVIPCEEKEYMGERYSFRFDGAMVGNHLALVPAGRCGDGCVVLDNKTEIEDMKEEEVKQMVADEVAGATSKAVADSVKKEIEAIDIGKMISDSVAKAIADAEEARQKKADEQAKKDAESEKAQKAKADALAAKVDLHTKLKPLLGDKYDASKSDKDLMIDAIGDSVKDAKDKSEEYLADKIDELVEARKRVDTQFDGEQSTGEIRLSAF
jgi:hypothetical protein